MRDTFVMRNGKLVPKRLAPPLIVARDARHYVIGDDMPALKHMGTGRVHTSKSRFRADTRAVGAVECGTDPAVARPGRACQPPDLVPFVQRAIAELESR